MSDNSAKEDTMDRVITHLRTAWTPRVGQRGAFIVFEGGDRCGKTTQSTQVVDFLNHLYGPKTAVWFKFPDRTTEIGQMINGYLTNKADMDDKCLHLLFSANRWEVITKIKKLLAEGVTVVADRYAYSGVAFSAAKGLDPDWCKAPDAGLPRPDMTIYLDLTIEESAKRGGFGLEKYETKDMQTKAREQFMKLVDSSWEIIDANKPVNVLQGQIRLMVTAAVHGTSTNDDFNHHLLWQTNPL